MQVGIDYGSGHLDLDVADERMVQARHGSPAPRLDDPAEAVRNVLERPIGGS